MSLNSTTVRGRTPSVRQGVRPGQTLFTRCDGREQHSKLRTTAHRRKNLLGAWSTRPVTSRPSHAPSVHVAGSSSSGKITFAPSGAAALSLSGAAVTRVCQPAKKEMHTTPPAVRRRGTAAALNGGRSR